MFFKLLIDGKDIDSGKYEYFPNAEALIKNPKATLECIRKIKSEPTNDYDSSLITAKYCIADEKMVNKAIDSAYLASETFKHFSISKRVKIIKDIRRKLVALRNNLVDFFVQEAHPIQLANWEVDGMEAGLADDTVDYFKSKMREEIGVVGDERVYLVRKPDGVVCLIPPRNAPCSNSCTAVLSLLPGNTLVLKPPLRNPISTLYFWREIVYPVLKDHGAPDGTLNIVVGNSKRILDLWLNSEKVNDIIFFGDSERGEKIGQRIFSAGKKPILELSGNDILVVWKDANLELAVKSVCDAFLGSSQICMVPKIALIHPLIYDDFIHLLLKSVKKVKAGLPSDKSVSLTPINRLDEYFSAIKDAESRGATVLCGGKRIDWMNQVSSDGSFVEPTVIGIGDSEAVYNYECVKKEGFFPLLPVIKANKLGEDNDDKIAQHMIDIVNANDYGLRFSIWIESDKYLRKFAKYVDNAGLFRVNSRHAGFSFFLGTHGGTKKSGGPFGELNYFWQKTSHLQGISRTKLRVFDELPG